MGYHRGVGVLFLDVDGVLNRTGYRPGTSLGLRSWIEPELAQRLCEVVRATGASIVLSSDWRRDRELTHLSDELRAAGIDAPVHDVTPVLGTSRWTEIQHWMTSRHVAPESVAIVDDGFDMGPLAARFVRCSPLTGLDAMAAAALIALLR
jgi:hypothetical protein